MSNLGTRDNRHSRPFLIAYVKGDRTLHDSARSIDGARTKCRARLEKPHNRGDICRIYQSGRLIDEISN